MKLAKKAILVLMVITLTAAAIYIVNNILASFRYFTSFPWWSAFVFAAVYFGPVLLVESMLYGLLTFIEKKR